jgi:uncharacterized protein YdaU (DUF1376 family)
VSLRDPFLFDQRKFWADEDVLMLDWRHVGLYMRLLSVQWEEGTIPADRRRLRAVLAGGLRGEVTDEDLDAVLVFFEEAAESRLGNAGMEEDRAAWLAKKEAHADRSRAGGKASGKSRRAKREPPVQPVVQAEVEPEVNRNPTQREASSSSSSVSESKKAEDPPLPPAGGDRSPPAGRKKRKGRQIPPVTIPPSLTGLGLDREAFAKRVRTCKATKKAETWQTELDRLAPMVEECGAAAVVEAWNDSIASGWQGCTPEMVRRKAQALSKDLAWAAPVDFHDVGRDPRPVPPPEGEVYLETSIPFDDWEEKWLPAIAEAYGEEPDSAFAYNGDCDEYRAADRAAFSDEGAGLLVLGSENATMSALLREALERGGPGEWRKK